jgi:hypothetical protein
VEEWLVGGGWEGQYGRLYGQMMGGRQLDQVGYGRQTSMDTIFVDEAHLPNVSSVKEKKMIL